MRDRTPCLVPFCRRTAKAENYDGEEIICGKHYRAAPKSLRMRYGKIRRELNTIMNSWPDPDAADIPTKVRLRAERLFRISDWMWNRIKKVSIEAAGGIG